MKKILVTGVGGPTPRSFVRAIKLYGGIDSSKYEFIGVDCNPLAYGLYDKSLFTNCLTVPLATSDLYWSKINEIINKFDIDGAIILPEVEVLEWAKNKSKLEKPIKLHLPSFELAKELINKHSLHRILKDTPWIPKFMKLDPEDFDYFKIANSLGDTFWIRSTEGSSGLGSLKIESENSLIQWIAINPGVKEFIATEFLPGRNMACKLLYFNNELVASACAERVNYIMSKVAPSGITGNTSFGRLLNEPNLVQISQNTLELIEKKIQCGLNGIFTVDYKEDRLGNPMITEINIRHVAFTSSLAAGGANLPLDTLNFMFNDDLPMVNAVHYKFENNLIFLRDVDGPPIIMKESNLYS